MNLESLEIAILAENQYEDLELWYPKLRFEEEAANVSIIGTGSDVYHSKHGYPVTADKNIKDVKAEDFDAVVIPGGYAPDYMRRCPEMVDFVSSADEYGKIIGAICHGGWLLISAGIVEGKQVTGFYSIQDDLVNAGGIYVDKAVVSDGNLITSRFPADLPDFCRAIINAVQAKVVAKV